MRIRHLTRNALAALTLGAATLVVQAQVPDGKIGIHYSRCDNNYEGWGLHTWKNPGIPLPGVEWQKPMMPTGTSSFGVYWHTDLAEYGSSQTVNYIIHKGDTKEQGGKDMKFSGKEYKEIWVNDGDRKIYFSLADAQKARAEKPCP
ncbi:MAG: hypothetical protein RLZZ352_1546 [Pseudomonadota bacterium]|jgi:hypothetical protein